MNDDGNHDRTQTKAGHKNYPSENRRKRNHQSQAYHSRERDVYGTSIIDPQAGLKSEVGAHAVRLNPL
jgi:hypothetical protein